MPSQVIVNADDFGLNEHTNAVILHAFHSGLISSATAMATMPAFKAACALAQQPALRGRVGLHFNLTYGKPLSEAIRALRSTPSSEIVMNNWLVKVPRLRAAYTPMGIPKASAITPATKASSSVAGSRSPISRDTLAP